jgi:hypothetical protein
VALYAYLATGILCLGIDSAIHFNGPPIDGPFQLFNALRRIDAGGRIGADFQFFHGAGVPFLHLLPFRLFGSGFFGSELSRQTVSTALFGLTYFAVFYAWTRSVASAARLSLAAACLTILSRSYSIFLPINSLLGPRSTMPLMVGAILVVPLAPRVRAIATGLAVGGALLLGTEQGLAIIAALVAATVLRVAFNGQRERLIALAAILLTAASTYIAFLLFTGGVDGLRGATTYNFKTIPADQFWYFGAPPNRFLFEWAQLWYVPTTTSRLVMIGLAVVGTLVRWWRHRHERSDTIFAELVLAIYAVLSMTSLLGSFAPVYLQPGLRVAFILGLLAVYRFGSEQTPAVVEFVARNPTVVRHREALVATICALLVMYIHGGGMKATLTAPIEVAGHFRTGFVQELAPAWQRERDLGRLLLERTPTQPGQPKLWSTYSTIVESDAGIFHPSFDYLIHALGSRNRAAYVNAFIGTQPALVQTVRPTHTIYEEWLEENHWEFYRELLRRYRLDSNSDWTFFWARRDSVFDDRPTTILEGAFPPGQAGIALGVDAPPFDYTLLEVRLRYHVRNPWRVVPVIGSLPRYLVTIDSAVNRTPLSLAPYETVRTFPIIVRGSRRVLIRFHTQSLVGGARLVIDSARVTRLAVSPDNEGWLRDFVRATGKPILY